VPVSCLGDFRDILLSMFETYSYERNIYATGVSLMVNTLYRAIQHKHRLRVGTLIDNLLCRYSTACG
jgi:hypothetical protein